MSGDESSSEFKDRFNQIIRNRRVSFTMPIKKGRGAISKRSVQVEQDQEVFQTPVHIVEREQSTAVRLFPDRFENNNRSLPSRTKHFAPQPSAQTVVMDSNAFRLSDLLSMVPFNGAAKGCEMIITNSERLANILDNFLSEEYSSDASILCKKSHNNFVYLYSFNDQARGNHLKTVVDMYFFYYQLSAYSWRNNNRPPVIHYQICNAPRYLVSDRSVG